MKTLLTLALIVVGHIAFGQDRIHRIDSLLSSMYSDGSFSGNVLIAEKGNVIYNKSFGLANEKTKAQLNENSIFELASVSKQFTAMAIVKLKEEGKLNYDDQMSKYIPELNYYKGITIRNLLNHTSGLPDYMEVMDTLFDKTKIADNQDIITIFSHHQPPVYFEPNEQWEYSNTGYAILASIIEKVSGMTYGDYLNKVIFKPLKMTNTFVYRRRYAPEAITNYAYGYVYSDSLKQYVLPDELPETNMVVWLDGIVGDGTVNSTVMDLLKWDRALYTDKLISAESKMEIFNSPVLNDQSKTEYGFGWFTEDNGLYGNVVSHTGGWPGYLTLIDRHIQNDKTIIVLLNHSNDNTFIPVTELRRILYNTAPITYITLTKEESAKFAGQYKNDNGKINTMAYANETLYRLMDSGDKFELRPISSTKFQVIGFSPDVFYEFIVKGNQVEKYIVTQPETRVVKELVRIN